MQKVRPPAVAGTFYPGNAQQLQAALDKYLEQADPPHLSDVRAVIVPHAGYIYSAPTAAYAFRLLAERPTAPERIFLLGPAHQAWFPGVALVDYESFQTPLGQVPVAEETVQQLDCGRCAFPAPE